MFSSNSSKIMAYKQKSWTWPESQCSCWAPSAGVSPLLRSWINTFQSLLTPSEGFPSALCVCGYYFECVQPFLRCHWTLLRLTFRALTLKQIDSVLEKAWILFSALQWWKLKLERVRKLCDSPQWSPLFLLASSISRSQVSDMYRLEHVKTVFCKFISSKSYFVACCVSDSLKAGLLLYNKQCYKAWLGTCRIH